MSNSETPLTYPDLHSILKQDIGLHVKTRCVRGMDSHGSTCCLPYCLQRPNMVRMTMREKNASNRCMACRRQNGLRV